MRSGLRTVRGASGEWSSRQRWCESGDPRTLASVPTRRGSPGRCVPAASRRDTPSGLFPGAEVRAKATLTNRNSPIRLSYDESAIACGSIVETGRARPERLSSSSQPRFPAAAKIFPVSVPDSLTLARAMPMKGLHESRSHALPEGRFLGFPDIFPVLREDCEASGPDCGRN